MSFPLILNNTDCIQCGACEGACSFQAIHMEDYPVINEDICRLCGNCSQACPTDALVLKTDSVQPSPNVSQSNGIWVLALVLQGAIVPVTFELLGTACELAVQQPQPVSAILIGYACAILAPQLIAAGADSVYIVEKPELAPLIEDRYADVLALLIHKYHPSILLTGATRFGRGVAARVAALVDTGLTADCTALSISPVSGNLLQQRPAFGGNLLATIETPFHRPQMATVRPKVMKAKTPDFSHPGEIIICSPEQLKTDDRVELLAEYLNRPSVSIADASVLVAGGKGMQTKEKMHLLYELAEALGGTVAASRAAVEAGWLPYDCQVGQTGKTVAPRLYIACGISGQIQHTAAISGAQTIVAINSDPDAAIFQYAHYGMVGDAIEIIPQLIQELS